MKNFTFTGDWSTRIYLPLFAAVCTYDKRPNSKSDIDLQFGEDYNTDPDPMPEQIATVNYVLNNEEAILKSLHKHIKEVLIPLYITYIGEDEVACPELPRWEDLGRTIRITGMHVYIIKKGVKCYYRLDTEFSGDPEHGMSFVLYEDVFLKCDPIGELDADAEIYEHMGIDPSTVRQFNVDRYENRDRSFQRPNEKYGILKEWQIDVNHDYLNKLMRKGDLEELKSLVEEGVLNLDQKFSYEYVIDMAVKTDQRDIIKYLVEKGADKSRFFSPFINKSVEPDRLKFLISQGGKITDPIAWGYPILINEIIGIINELNRKAPRRARIDEHKERINKIVEAGADLQNADGQGNDYFTVLTKKYRPEALYKKGIKNIIEGKENLADIDLTTPPEWKPKQTNSKKTTPKRSKPFWMFWKK